MTPIFCHKDNPQINLFKNKFEYVFPVSSIKECVSSHYCWFIDKDVELTDDFKVNIHVDSWDMQYIHQYTTKDGHIGLYLIPYSYKFSSGRELKNTKIIESDCFSKIVKLYDIIFLSYKEPFAEENYANLSKRFPRAKRISGVKGIYEAHAQAAQASQTDHFWVVDADTIVDDNFNFDHQVPSYEFDVVYIWYSKNDINGLTYGNGGIKLIPKYIFDINDESKLDITTGLSKHIKVITETVGIHKISQSPLYAWRSAFREVVKLTAQTDEESQKRLKTWLYKGLDAPNGSYCLTGARAGYRYAKENADNKSALELINDYDWLLEQFQKHYSDIFY